MEIFQNSATMIEFHFFRFKIKPSIKYSVTNIKNIAELEKTIENHIPSNNIFYIIRVDGSFTQVFARSKDRINNPKDYEPLLPWMKNQQNKFYFNNTSGSLIIVKSPSIIKTLGLLDIILTLSAKTGKMPDMC